MLREQIIKARKEQGYTQGSLASVIGVRQATISDFESGKRSLSSDILEKILQTLEINFMTIIEEKKMQLKLSGEIAAELISQGIANIDKMSKSEILSLTESKCGNYIEKLVELSEIEYLKWEKRDEDYKTWNMFHTLLKLDIVYQLRTKL